MDNGIVPDPTAPLTESSTAPQTGTPPAPTEWRVPQTDPRVWARGMTADELLNVGNQMYAGLSQMASQPVQTYQPPAQRQNDFALPGDDDVVDGKTFKQALASVAGSLQQTQGNADQLAQMSLSMVQNRYAKVFAKYGPELMTEINKLPRSMWSVDNLGMAVEIVQGRHVEDLAKDMARDLAANFNLSARSDGASGGNGAASGFSLESDALPADYRAKLAKQGVTMEMVRSFCSANGMTVKQWFDSAGKMAPIGEG